MWITRPARPGAGAGRGAHRGPGGRALRLHRHLRRAARARGNRRGPAGCTRRCSRHRSRCSTSRRRAGRSPARSRPRPGTTTRRASPPGCSRPRTVTSTSPRAGTGCGGGCARCSATPACATIPASPPARRARRTATAINERIQEHLRERTGRKWIEVLNGAGGPLRADPPDGRDVGGPAGRGICGCSAPRTTRRSARSPSCATQ